MHELMVAQREYRDSKRKQKAEAQGGMSIRSHVGAKPNGKEHRAARKNAITLKRATDTIAKARTKTEEQQCKQ